MATRPAEKTDVEAIARIVVGTPLWQRYGVTLERARQVLEAGLAQGDAILVSGERELAGFAWVQLRGAFVRSPYLKWIGVAGGNQSRGLGRELLRAAEDAARRERPELFLLCSDFNAAGQRFYEREGYARLGVIPDYVLAGVGEVIFFKKLEARSK